MAPRGPGSRRWAEIWSIVERIPEGRVATYGQVAALAGLPGQARQVGYALHALPEGSTVPWHRVINARGEVSLRSAASAPGWLGFQRHLLEEEGVAFDASGRVALGRFRWEPSVRPARSRPSRASRQVAAIRAALRPLGDPRRAADARAYLKSDLEFLGLRTDDLRGAVRDWLRSRPGFDRPALLALVEGLWATPVHELRGFALELLRARRRLLAAVDLDLLERLLRDSATWAYVDLIAVHLVGPLVDAHPRLARRLDRWVGDPDPWLRRSALLSLLLACREGRGDWERLKRYGDALLEDRDVFVRKALGWVLRETGKRRPDRVRDFLEPRLERLPGVALREAVKPLPAAERHALLAAWRRRRQPDDRRTGARRPSPAGARNRP